MDFNRGIYCRDRKNGRFACITEEEEYKRREKATRDRARPITQWLSVAAATGGVPPAIAVPPRPCHGGATLDDSTPAPSVAVTCEEEARPLPRPPPAATGVSGAVPSDGATRRSRAGAADGAGGGWKWTGTFNSIEEKRAAFAACAAKGQAGEEQPDSAKWARSLFVPLWWDATSDESVVLCRPVTGRTHQLRVHLSTLGCPIVLDVDYGDTTVSNYGCGGGTAPSSADDAAPLTTTFSSPSCLARTITTTMPVPDEAMAGDGEVGDPWGVGTSLGSHYRRLFGAVTPSVRHQERHAAGNGDRVDADEVYLLSDEALRVAKDPLCPDCHSPPRFEGKGVAICLHALSMELVVRSTARPLATVITPILKEEEEQRTPPPARWTTTTSIRSDTPPEGGSSSGGDRPPVLAFDTPANALPFWAVGAKGFAFSTT